MKLLESLLEENVGEKIHQNMTELFPTYRTISGKGFRDSLAYLQKILPGLRLHEIESGSQVFDWEVPKEYNINDAWVKNEAGEKIIDFKEHNLHIVGYSIPTDEKVSLAELDKHLYSLPDKPNAIPYITSYYKERWGFCVRDEFRKTLKDEIYHVYIDSKLEPGVLNYGELLIKGKSEKEILLSSYLCHPSMANNELSGPLVLTEVARLLLERQDELEHSYRIVFLPETIGSLIYMSRNIEEMQKNVVAGYVLSCLGDENNHSFLNTRKENTLTDKVTEYIFKENFPGHKQFNFQHRGSDERQYCAPGIDLPVCVLSRTLFTKFYEYHTSLDDLEYVTPKGLYGGLLSVIKCLDVLENNFKYMTQTKGEPQLGKRGLYPNVSTGLIDQEIKWMMNVIAYSDGEHDLIDISQKCSIPFWDTVRIAKKLADAEVLIRV